MIDTMQNYIREYSQEIQTLFSEIRKLIIKSVPVKIDEKLWAKLPSFYVENKFVRVIPFKDHINIEASTIVQHKSKLNQYKLTQKGMLQIYIDQDIPYDVLKEIFTETLTK